MENCQLPQVQIGEFYFQICKGLYAGGLSRRPWLWQFCRLLVRMLCLRSRTGLGRTGFTARLHFLVISCPCALVISIPLSFFAGIGGASKEGILIKGSNYLETLSSAKYVVFDKTGTLTQGIFEVNAVHHSNLDEAKLLEYAALAESSSSHPISKSLRKAYGGPIDRSRVTDLQEISGHGVLPRRWTAVSVAAGNAKLMEHAGDPV